MENIAFYEQMNLFMENKSQGKPWPTYEQTRMRTLGPMYAYVARVPEGYEKQVFCIKVEVWNESHVV